MWLPFSQLRIEICISGFRLSVNEHCRQFSYIIIKSLSAIWRQILAWAPDMSTIGRLPHHIELAPHNDLIVGSNHSQMIVLRVEEYM